MHLPKPHTTNLGRHAFFAGLLCALALSGCNCEGPGTGNTPPGEDMTAKDDMSGGKSDMQVDPDMTSPGDMNPTDMQTPSDMRDPVDMTPPEDMRGPPGPGEEAAGARSEASAHVP